MPFKSEKQRRFLWANEPGIARKWEKEDDEQRYVSGGMVKLALRNSMAKNTQKLSDLTSRGMVKTGSLTPGKVGTFKKQCEVKFRDS
tara:strand:+ start:495 stop:755 length:261 start_codon:yes stop_codon:yes gene_type:complete